MSRTLLIMAGGTGGHVFPALAVASHLRDKGWRVVWLGAKTGMEATLVPQHGYEMAWVRFSGLRGKGFAGFALLPLNLLIAFWQCAKAIFRIRPGHLHGDCPGVRDDCRLSNARWRHPPFRVVGAGRLFLSANLPENRKNRQELPSA